MALSKLKWLKYLFVQQDEGQDEQDYHIGKRKKHLAGEHSIGVSSGLGVTENSPTPDLIVLTAAGRAILSDGHDPEIESQQQVNLTSLKPGSGSDTIYITIDWDDVDWDSYFVDELGSSQDGRVRDSYTLAASASAPSGTELEIARVELTYDATAITDAAVPATPGDNEIDLTNVVYGGKEVTLLKELADVSADEADAFNGMATPSSGNVIATITGVSSNSDVTANTAAKHTQDTDQKLDEGGGNELTAAETRTHLDSTSDPHSVTKTQVGLSNVENTKVNLAASTDPDENDDSGSSYTVGSLWVNTTTDQTWVCVDASASAAVWLPVGDAYDGLARNVIINPNFEIWQRGATFATIGAGAYTADRWYGFEDLAASGVLSIARQVPAGSPADSVNYVARLTSGTDQDAIGATEIAYFRQSVEGFNFKEIDRGWGTLSFYARAGASFTMCVAFTNEDNTRAYIKEIAVTSSWQRFTMTVPFNTSGTWKRDKDAGLHVYFILAAGTNHNGGSADAWNTGTPSDRATTNQENFFHTSGPGWMEIGQVQLNKGRAPLPFILRQYGEELALCQRYYQRMAAATGSTDAVFSSLGLGIGTSTARVAFVPKVTMRAIPTVAYGNTVVLADEGTSWALTGLAVGVPLSSPDRVLATATVGATPLSQNDPYFVRAGSDATAYVELDAEF